MPGADPARTLLTESWRALKDAVKRFESDWQREPRPRIDDYLPVGEPLRLRVLIELVHIDLELRLKAGAAVRIEEYLNRYPALAEDGALTLELIAAEREFRRRGVDHLTLDEYARRFPQHRAVLPEYLEQPTVVGLEAPQSRSDVESDPQLVPQVDGYEILSPLGRGGMGAVYMARQLSLERLVALKFLPAECARDPLWLSRFRREARTASGLNHPNICTIHDTGEGAGRPFLSMELIDGQTLATLVPQRPAVREAVALIAQVARALSAAHAAGVVHRDVKPENLMVRADGLVKVLDFGLARRIPKQGVESPAPDGTDAGAWAGTLLYMSPEQARVQPLEAATDIFSLGLVLYELCTGQHPFRAESTVDVLQAIVAQAAISPARLNPEVPVRLDNLIQHMLTKDPRLRPTAADVEATLNQLTATPIVRPLAQQTVSPKRPTVGRQPERAALRAAFEQAASGSGLLLCVTGEPGLGKTTLVESVFEDLAADGGNLSLARGRCSERLAGAEAYLPFLEALDSLLQCEGGASAAQVMKLLAPSWYVELAPLTADDSSSDRIFAEAKEASQERRKRELVAFLQEMSRRRPLVLFVDDVHWADPSSVDLLAYLGSKCPGLPVLLVLTYRSSDLLRSQHPFGSVKLDLQAHGVCREIALPFLSREDFDGYLAMAFAEHDFPAELAALLHERTEGNPLFMVDLLQYLRDRGVIVQDGGRWALVRALPDLRRELPESVRSMIQRKLDHLSAADHQLLMAASVQGPAFDSAVVADVLGQAAAEVEERLEILDRVHFLVRRTREQTLPDGALTVRYGFVHVLYQNSLYGALQPTRKSQWSAAAAESLLSHYADKSSGLAAELAMLFEAARDHGRAADYYLAAAENAARIFAHHEAVSLARRGLALLETLPDTPARSRRELSLLVTLATQLQVAQGFAMPEAERIYARASALCERVSEPRLHFSVHWGWWMYYEVRGAPRKSRELVERLYVLAKRRQDRAQLLQVCQARAITTLCLGDPATAREHMEQGLSLYDPKRHGTHTYLFGSDPAVGCLAFGAVALWLLGYPDRAVEHSREAVARARTTGHASTLALSLHFAAILRQYRREGALAQANAEEDAALAAEHGLTLWSSGASIMRGWALAEQGACASGIAQLRQGLCGQIDTGARTYHSLFAGLLADALGRDGRIEEGLTVLAEALGFVEESGETFHAAELLRLKGEFLLRQPSRDTASEEAEACFRRALDLARQQKAKSLGLRAAVSLTRLCQAQNRYEEARPLLAECYHCFTEGFDTSDLQQAQALLEGRTRPSST